MMAGADEARSEVPEVTPGWEEVWRTSEGRILAVGIALAVTSVGLVLVLSLWAPQRYQPIMAMSAAHLAFGRAAAMSLGYAQHLGHLPVIGINLLIEVVLVLVLYPLFVLGFRRLPMARPLDRMMSRARLAADAHRALVRRFGALGLAIFVWFPFWMTGPVVGSFIGFLIGLPTWLNLTVVLSGTTVAIIGWAFFLYELSALAARSGTYGPAMLTVALILAFLVAGLLRRSGERH